MSKHLVRVRALSNVMGLHYGDVAEVVATPRVEILIHGGHLEWVDEAGVKVVESAEPVMSDASFDDEPDDTDLTEDDIDAMIADSVEVTISEVPEKGSAHKRRTVKPKASDAE